jgi:excisionase family DNA binding protein
MLSVEENEPRVFLNAQQALEIAQERPISTFPPRRRRVPSCLSSCPKQNCQKLLLQTTNAVSERSKHSRLDLLLSWSMIGAMGSTTMPQFQRLYLTVDEAATVLGISPQIARKLCRDKQMPGARKFGLLWRIPANKILPEATELPRRRFRKSKNEEGTVTG